MYYLNDCLRNPSRLSICLSEFFRNLAIAILGANLIILPYFMWNKMGTAYEGGLNLQRRKKTLFYTYNILGGIILLVGVGYALIKYLMNIHLRFFFEGLILAFVGAAFIVLPYLITKIIGNNSS